MARPHILLSRRALFRLAFAASAAFVACGGSAAPTAAPKKATGHDSARTTALWNDSGGDNLLKGKNFQTLFQGLPDRMRAFALKDTHLRCIDEGTPGGLHMAGSGVLYQNAVEDLRGKITGIWTHENCGAAALYVKNKKIQTESPDAVADDEAKKLAEKLGIPYLGRIAAKDMRRPTDIHTARAIYYDGTGSFDPTLIPGMPQGFIISRKLISDPAYARAEVEVAIGIALGEHGFGSHFTGAHPLYVVIVGGLTPESIPSRTMAEEMRAGAEKYHNVEVQTIIAVQESSGVPAPAIVKPADPSKDPRKDGHGAGAHGAPGGALAPSFGPTLAIRDRMVNLADPGGRRYLRFSVAIEFAPHGEGHGMAEDWSGLISYRSSDGRGYQDVTGGPTSDPQKEFEEAMKRYIPPIEDAVTTVLSSKTFAELTTAEGKDQAKRDIRDRVQRVVGDLEKVTNVYFTEFVIQ
ncbi:MAG: flagellar basal body-associated FliL family protein [Chloroflexi bacterium]|nr:flagellar basal body-associated FliL family protein [Chloroflexota bacterium]